MRGSPVDSECHVCRASGQLTGATARAVRDELRGHLTDGRDVLLDLAEVTFTDSEGLGALVSVFRSAALVGRRFVIFAPRSNFRSLLRLTRLQRVFEVVDDEETARRRLAEKSP
jgi:anti-sigma B factor antagonist